MLTDNYDKSVGSNISKLLQIVASELEDIHATLVGTEDWRDIDQAEGAVLDRIGFNVEQFRGGADDGIFRVLIKSKIGRNRSDGTIDKMIDVLSIALGADPSEIQIEETYTDLIAPEPAAISLISIPFAKLLEIGMSGAQFGQLVAKMTAAGVGVKSIEFFGTFELSSQYDALENDTDIGFGQLVILEGFGTEDYGSGTYGGSYEIIGGGTLGAIYRPGVDDELPI